MTDTTTISTSGAGAAAVAEKVVEDVMKVEPMVVSGVGMFVPGAAPIVAMVQPWIVMAAPYLERALTDISQGNGGDVLGAFIELMQHVSKGSANSPILSSITDPSQQASG